MGVCERCGKLGHTQVRCDRDAFASSPGCFACGGDHQKANCPHVALACETCGKTGHIAAMCHSSGEGKGYGKGCFACGGNHQKADCPNRFKVCDICGKVGHLKFMCEAAPALGKGKASGKTAIRLVSAYSAGKGSTAQGCFACGGNDQKAQ